ATLPSPPGNGNKKFPLSSLFERQAEYLKSIWDKGLRLLTAPSRRPMQTGQEPHKGNAVSGSGVSGRASTPGGGDNDMAWLGRAIAQSKSAG
ncbi:TPA: hypothetical protein ACKP0J_004666, partial [Serratia marcescens]